MSMQGARTQASIMAALKEWMLFYLFAFMSLNHCVKKEKEIDFSSAYKDCTWNSGKILVNVGAVFGQWNEQSTAKM